MKTKYHIITFVFMNKIIKEKDEDKLFFMMHYKEIFIRTLLLRFVYLNSFHKSIKKYENMINTRLQYCRDKYIEKILYEK